MTTSSHAECQFMLKARSQLRVAACNALRAVIHEHRPAGSPGFLLAGSRVPAARHFRPREIQDETGCGRLGRTRPYHRAPVPCEPRH